MGTSLSDQRKNPLDDRDRFRRDTAAKSVGFFSRTSVVAVDFQIISELKRHASDSGQNARLSLHCGPDKILHEMIICHHASLYNRPKKNLHKSKSFHILDGEMAVFAFDSFCLRL